MCVFVSVKFHPEKQTFFKAPLEQWTVWENHFQLEEEAADTNTGDLETTCCLNR